MQLQCESSLHVVLGLEMHLKEESAQISRVRVDTYINELVHVFDIDGIASDAPDKIHEP